VAESIAHHALDLGAGADGIERVDRCRQPHRELGSRNVVLLHGVSF